MALGRQKGEDVIPDEARMDARDAMLHSQIGHWVLLEWRDGPVRPPKGQACGTHLATFILCSHGSEIRGLNFCWLYRQDDGQVFRVGEFLAGIEASWFFKYATLKQFDIEPLPADLVSFLGLPTLGPGLDVIVPDEVLRARGDTRLDPFRHPGHPDHVQAWIEADHSAEHAAGSGLLGEIVWVRLTEQVAHGEFAGMLLSQPMCGPWTPGEVVSLTLLDAPPRQRLVCRKIGHARTDDGPSSLLQIDIHPEDGDDGEEGLRFIESLMAAEGVRGTVSTFITVPELRARLGISQLPAVSIGGRVVLQGRMPTEGEILDWFNAFSPPAARAPRRSPERTGWPSSLREAVTWLVEGMHVDDKRAIASADDQALAVANRGWGQGIRNGFGLWAGNHALLADCGTDNADDASMVIIRAVRARLSRKVRP